MTRDVIDTTCPSVVSDTGGAPLSDAEEVGDVRSAQVQSPIGAALHEARTLVGDSNAIVVLLDDGTHQQEVPAYVVRLVPYDFEDIGAVPDAHDLPGPPGTGKEVVVVAERYDVSAQDDAVRIGEMFDHRTSVMAEPAQPPRTTGDLWKA